MQSSLAAGQSPHTPGSRDGAPFEESASSGEDVVMLHPDPRKIIVPRKHGEVLIEPSLEALASALRAAPAPWPARADGKSWQVLRQQAREQMLAAANQWSRLTGQDPLPADAAARRWVLTGHQVEFYHAGVWAKVIAADELARRTGAVAFDLLVDHDVIDDIGFDVPVETGDGGWGRTWEGVPEESAAQKLAHRGLPSESLEAPGLETFLQWDGTLAEYPATQTDAMAHYLSALRYAIGTHEQQGAGTALPYTQWMSAARASFEQSLELKVAHVPATWVCRGPAWDAFVQAWIDHAATWTELYNRHLAAYRWRQGIKGAQHPMPDLHREPGRGVFELPFWVYRPGEPRQRMMVGEGQPGIVPQENSGGGGPCIRPRALSFTMFVRLYLSDLFIHGIGGALYDQITDGLLQDLFHVVPAYGCVSAAWLLPLGQAIPDEDLAALVWRRHHAEHNPQLVIDPFTALRTDVAELITERKALVTRIAQSLSEARRTQRTQRREWFARLHAVNRLLHEKSPRMLVNLDQQLMGERHAAEQNKVLLWREWFFALHTRESLGKLIECVREKT